MTDFYLITGFLGAGKTTFLKNFIRLFPGKRVHLIINEFGRVGVDGHLLRELGAAMDEISNGSIFCSCRLDKFEEVLDSIVQQNPPDALIVEASGLSDPTAVRKILGTEKYGWISYKGSVCLVDAANYHKVIGTARVCGKQLSVSELLLINKADLVTSEQVKAAEADIRGRCPRADVRVTTFGRIEPEWLAALEKSDHSGTSEDEIESRDITLQKCAITINEAMSAEQLEHFIRMFIEDTYRVKGFVTLQGALWLVDCTGAMLSVSRWKGETPAEAHTIVALSGKGMSPRKSVRKAAEWYPGLIEGIEMG